MKKTWFLLFLFLILHISVSTVNKTLGAKNEVLTSKKSPPASFFHPSVIVKAQGDFQSVIVPLKRAGKLILIDAIVDSIQGNLILDTGSAGMVLNSLYFRKTRRAGSQSSGGITGDVGAISKYRIKKLAVSDAFYENFDADMTDLGHLERSRNVRILGFFGLSMLRDFEVVIDLKNNLMELHRLDRSGQRLNITFGQPSFDLVLPASNMSDVLFVEASINKKKFLFCLDTGAESNVLSNQLPDKVLNTVTVTRRSTLLGVGSKKVNVFHGTMNDFSIGSHSMNGMPTLITSLSAMAHAYGLNIDGMLGCDFFEKGVFYIDLKRGRVGICFHKNQTE